MGKGNCVRRGAGARLVGQHPAEEAGRLVARGRLIGAAQPNTVYINGRYTAQRTTGVQRVATELVRALDDQLDGDERRWVLLCPRGAAVPELRRIAVRRCGWRGVPLHVWEQVVLPAVVGRSLLLSLAGSMPWMARHSVVMLHDAAVFDHPEAYTVPFVAWYRLSFGRAARHAQRLLTVSAWAQQRLALRLGVPASRFTVLPNGSDHLQAVAPDERVLDRLGLRGKRYLLAVASTNRTKNIAALRAAFADLCEVTDACFVLAGGDNDRVFRSAATTSADPPRWLRAGSVDDAALKALYRHALALVIPSLYEGFGLPAIEAMACGCPVAAARIPALVETCGDAALYFDPQSVPDIGRALRALLEGGEPVLARLRAAGLQRAQAFSWRRSAELLLQAAAPTGTA